MSKNCLPCDLAAGAAVMIKAYCKDSKDKCSLIVKEFQRGDMTLEELAKKVDADSKFMERLRKEVNTNVTLKKALDEYYKNK